MEIHYPKGKLMFRSKTKGIFAKLRGTELFFVLIQIWLVSIYS